MSFWQAPVPKAGAGWGRWPGGSAGSRATPALDLGPAAEGKALPWWEAVSGDGKSCSTLVIAPQPVVWGLGSLWEGGVAGLVLR